MPVRAVCKPHSSDLKKTDASLVERLPPAPASRVRDPLGELVRTRVGGVTYIGAVTRTGVRFRGVSVTDVAMPVRAVCKPHSPDLKRGALATDTKGCIL